MMTTMIKKAGQLKFPLRFASDRGTARVLAHMLKENTGVHFLDSGGLYGRHWQQNQHTNFSRQPYGWLQVDRTSSGEIVAVYPRISVYHYLLDRVIFFPQEDGRFRRFERQTADDTPWRDVVDGYLEYLGYDPDDREFVARFTSAGDDCFLTQDISGVAYPLPEDERIRVVLLRIHNGCDLRGGWTYPRAFVVRGDGDEYDLMQWNQVTIACVHCRVWLHARPLTARTSEEQANGERHIYVDLLTEWPPFFGYPEGGTDADLKFDERGRVLCARCSRPLEVW